MKYLFTLSFLSILISCTPNKQDTKEQIISPETSSVYQPGFGDFMHSIQNHHNKLWFAGINENWDLAEFEIHELEELFEDIRTFHTNREETKMLPIIEPSLEQIDKAIEHRNTEAFKKAYTAFTNACNQCHRATQHEYIKIIIPLHPTFSNQDFTL